MEELLKVATDLGLSPLNLILLGMVYFMGAQSGSFPKFWKDKTENRPPTLHDIYARMVKLTNHFNDETTEKLTSLAQNQEDMGRNVKKISQTQDTISGDITEIKNRQDKWHEYGIKTRKET